MSDGCTNCGKPRPELPVWTFLVPIAIGAVSLALIVVFRGSISGRVLGGGVTLAFLVFAAWLAVRLKAVLSPGCPHCGQRPG